MTRYLLAGGGTAGHVNPLLAVADEIIREDPGSSILVLGTEEGLEARLVPERGYELATIPKVPFPRRPNLAALRFPGRFIEAVRQTRGIIREREIDAVIGFGGYAATPAYLGVRGTKAALSLHEANARPGLANRVGARRTQHVGVAFRDTPLRGAEWVGMPLRREIVDLDRKAVREEALQRFQLSSDRPVLLVTGGSWGATRLNAALVPAVADIVAVGWQILHIAGERSEVEVSDSEHYRMLRYCDRMDLALAITDLALGRAGAATVSELTALAIPAVFVPLAVGNGEQRFNVASLVDAEAALMVSDAQFGSEWIRHRLLAVLNDEQTRNRMSERMRDFGIRDGSERMLRLARRSLEKVGH